MTQMNLSTEQKHTDIKNRLVVAKGEWDVGGKDWEFGEKKGYEEPSGKSGIKTQTY